MRFETTFSLDLPDAQIEAYLVEFIQENPCRLHEAVAANPLAGTRCFHWTLKLVIRTSVNCEEKPGRSSDSIAAGAVPGLFGHVRAYTLALLSLKCEKHCIATC